MLAELDRVLADNLAAMRSVVAADRLDRVFPIDSEDDDWRRSSADWMQRGPVVVQRQVMLLVDSSPPERYEWTGSHWARVQTEVEP